jgi:hypothetical protein
MEAEIKGKSQKAKQYFKMYWTLKTTNPGEKSTATKTSKRE